MASKEDIARNLNLEDSCKSCGCAICLGALTDPRLLACLHAFCRECIDQLLVTAGQGCVSCPVCRTKTTLDVKGAVGLQKDITKKSDQPPSCQTCKEEGKTKLAFVWCETCKKAFCSDHTAPPVLSSGHSVGPLTSAEDSRLYGVDGPTTSQPCSEHGELLKYFCKKCDELVCGHCTAFGSHCQHTPIVLVNDVHKEQKDAVIAKVEKMRNDVLPGKERTLKAVEDVTEQLRLRADNARAGVRSHGERIVRTAQAFVEQRLQEIDDEVDTRCKVLDEQQDRLRREVDAMKTAIAFSDNLMEQSGSYSGDMSSVLAALAKRVDALVTGESNEKPESHARIMFENIPEKKLIEVAGKLVGVVNLCVASATDCVVSCESPTTSVVPPGKPVSFVIEAKDMKGNSIPRGGDRVVASFLKVPYGTTHQLAVHVKDQNDGHYALSWIPEASGEHVIKITVNGEKLPKTFSVLSHSWTFNPAMSQPGLVFHKGNSVVTRTHAPNARFSCVVGSCSMQEGRHRWTVRADSPSGETVDHLIGVVTKRTAKNYMVDHNGLSDLSFHWNNNGERCVAFMGKKRKGKLSPFQNGDLLCLNLNCGSHTLTIDNLRSGETDTISNLPQEELLPYFCMYYAGSSFTIT